MPLDFSSECADQTKKWLADQETTWNLSSNIVLPLGIFPEKSLDKKTSIIQDDVDSGFPLAV